MVWSWQKNNTELWIRPELTCVSSLQCRENKVDWLSPVELENTSGMCSPWSFSNTWRNVIYLSSAVRPVKYIGFLTKKNNYFKIVLCSVTPEPPGGYRPNPNQTFLNGHGSALCGGSQTASRLDSSSSASSTWPCSCDRGVEGSRPLLRLCHVWNF